MQILCILVVFTQLIILFFFFFFHVDLHIVQYMWNHTFKEYLISTWEFWSLKYTCRNIGGHVLYE